MIIETVNLLFTCNKTFSVFSGLLSFFNLALILPLLPLLWQQSPVSMLIRFVGLEETSLVLSESLHILIIRPVHVAAVQEVSDLVHLFSIPECAGQLRSWHRPHEVHASLSVLAEEWIILWYLDGETLRMQDQLADGSSTIRVAALDTSSIGVGESDQ